MIKEKVQAPVAVALAILALGLSAFAIFYTGSTSPQVKPANEIKMASAGTTYYIDAENGDDTNCNGTATTPYTGGYNQTCPFKTLTMIYAIKIAPGDMILLKRGQVWHESLALGVSGSVGSPITYGAYGEGDNPKPLIDGQNQLTSAIGVNGLAYLTIRDLTIINTYKPVVLYNANNIILDNLSIYNSNGSAGIALFGDQINKCESNIIRNSEVHDIVGTNADEPGDGILLYGQFCDNNVISSNNFHNNANEGIGIWGGSNNMISQNTVNNNGRSGIRVALTTAVGNVVEYNTSFANAQLLDDRYGIDLWMVGNDNIVRYNKVYSQRDTYNDKSVSLDPATNGIRYGSGGIRFDGGYEHSYATGNMSYYNLISGEYTGIDIFNFDNIQIYNNIVYNSKYAGIHFTSFNSSTPTSNTRVKNNIVYNVLPTAYLISAAGVSNSVIDNNLYYQGGAENFGWGMASKNYSQWKGFSGQDANSIVANPQFIDLVNFNVSSSSLAIDHGTDVALIQAYDGQIVPQGPMADIGVYESQIVVSKSVCGNKLIEDTEQCDGSNLNKQTCVTLGYLKGTLSCNSCQFRLSGCSNTCTLASQCKNKYGSSYSYCRSGKCCKKVSGKYICIQFYN